MKIYIGKEKWGPIAWNMLHSFSINNNKKIKENKKQEYYLFYTSFIFIIPCLICSAHYEEIITYIHPLEQDKITRNYLKRWVYDTHNIINDLLYKKKYPYKKSIEENKNIHHEDVIYFIKLIYINIDYSKISYYKFDQIYTFFIYFCSLYPILSKRKEYKKLIEKKEFKEIKTPNQFKKWFSINKGKL